MPTTVTLTRPIETSADEQRRVEQSAVRSELRLLWNRYKWRILLTYALFNVENILRLAQPLLLGWAINDLLKSTYTGLAAFAVGHLSFMMIGTLRRMYDTRVFTSIYADRVGELVLDQRRRGVDVSCVSARSALSKEFVDFLELHIPMIIRSTYSVAGAILMLVFFDWMLVVLCATIVVPVGVLNFVFGRRVLTFSKLLHDELERDVSVVARADVDQVNDHYRQVSRWRVRISDWEAFTTGAMELFILGLMVAALLRYCTLPGVAAGDIFAVFRYVLMFIMALDSLPLLVQQISRLKDIGGRMTSAEPL